jgi:hypothetical protein
MPHDAPLARMYRTEAGLALLVNALETYHAAHDAYPPAGPAGLRLATEYLSRKVNYLPGGPPADEWSRPYHYVPHTEYLETGSGAVQSAYGFFAPDSFQLYSYGADGESGLDASKGLKDNICNWNPDKSWRAVYHEYQRVFNEKRRAGP